MWEGRFLFDTIVWDWIRKDKDIDRETYDSEVEYWTPHAAQ